MRLDLRSAGVIWTSPVNPREVAAAGRLTALRNAGAFAHGSVRSTHGAEDLNPLEAFRKDEFLQRIARRLAS